MRALFFLVLPVLLLSNVSSLVIPYADDVSTRAPSLEKWSITNLNGCDTPLTRDVDIDIREVEPPSSVDAFVSRELFDTDVILVERARNDQRRQKQKSGTTFTTFTGGAKKKQKQKSNPPTIILPDNARQALNFLNIHGKQRKSAKKNIKKIMKKAMKKKGGESYHENIAMYPMHEKTHITAQSLDTSNYNNNNKIIKNTYNKDIDSHMKDRLYSTTKPEKDVAEGLAKLSLPS